MFLVRNQAGQGFVLPGSLRAIADGSAVTTATLTIVQDNNPPGTAAVGTLTHLSGGTFHYAPTAAETNCKILGWVLDGTGAITLSGSIRTTRADPDDAAALGLTRLDAAVSGVPAAVWVATPRTLTAFDFEVVASGTVDARVVSYATGLSPAEQAGGTSTFNPAVDEVEAGVTWHQAMQRIAATTVGENTGMEVGLPVYKAVGNPAQPRVRCVTDLDGNRSNMTYDA